MSIVGSLRSLFVAPARDAAAPARVREAPELNRDAPLAARLVDRALPMRCLLCADATARAVCSPCEAMLARTTDEACPRCRLPSSNGEVCGRCLRYPPRWQHLTATFMYEFPLDRLIVGAKHARDWGVFDWSAAQLNEWPHAANATLIPVPMAPERWAERGYNQAALLAHTLARRFDLRTDNEAIIRIRDTGSQAARAWVERRKNVKGAFAATRSFAGESMVLIDDVLTTGATLNECARAAFDAGAANVDAFVIARVSPPRARDRVQKFNRAVA